MSPASSIAIVAELLAVERARLNKDVVAHSSIQARALIDAADLLYLQRADTRDCALATLTRGSLRTSMILSTAEPACQLTADLAAHCDRLGVTELTLETIKQSESPTAPPAAGDIVASYANERLYFIDLQSLPQESLYSSNNRRNVNKARKAGVTIQRSTSADALATHFSLTDSSVARREHRGESVALRGSRDRSARFLRKGCAELFQAVHEGSTVSSNLVFYLGKNAYYYDGGSSSLGMSIGASHLLMHTIAVQLHDAGYQTLNMGIARAGNEGLIRFKEGFAAQLRFVDRVTYRRDAASLLATNFARHLLNRARRLLGFKAQQTNEWSIS